MHEIFVNLTFINRTSVSLYINEFLSRTKCDILKQRSTQYIDIDTNQLT